MTQSAQRSSYPELGCYLLPGHTRTPRDLITEVTDAERLGLGSAWISERFDVKEAGVCVGAAAAVTSRIHIGTAATNVNTRHPLAIASLASTANRLSEGRFALGIARGVEIRSEMWGLDRVDDKTLKDFVTMMRELFRGESVGGYEGGLGSFPYLHMSDWLDESIPILFAGFGPRSLEFAGSVFDGVVLHTFLTDEAVERAVSRVRRGAERAGRDPSDVKVWSVLAVACDPSHEVRLRRLVARMATYMQAPGYGDLLVSANHWDETVLDRFRDADVVAEVEGAIDSVATLEQLEAIDRLIPVEWLPAAVGDPSACAARIADQFRAGADGVILHASPAAELAPVLEAYGQIRDRERFSNRTNRPA